MGYQPIIQISTKPIPKDEYICEGDFYEHWFNGEVADWFQDVDEEDQKEEIASAMRYVPGVQFLKGKRMLVIKDKKKYIESFYECFKEHIEAMSVTKEQFLENKSNDEDDLSGHMYSLNRLWNNKFGLYLYDPWNGELKTISEFMRSEKDGDQFYVGGIVLYHY